MKQSRAEMDKLFNVNQEEELRKSGTPMNQAKDSNALIKRQMEEIYRTNQ
jgi:hypothetical protein